MSATRLSPESLGDYQAALKAAGVDGWLFYDFRGTNPIAGELIGVGGFVTRRFFVWLPTVGTPVAVTHAIEQGVWNAWPDAWKKVVYSSWVSLESHVKSLVAGKRIATALPRDPGRWRHERSGPICNGRQCACPR